MNIEKDPFRLFFPLGAILAIVGVLPWSFHVFGMPTYPVEFHRAIMMNGFMLSFVCGFLMTAIPRFTSTDYAKWREILVIGGALILASAFAITGLQFLHHLTASMVLFGLMALAVKRFRKRKSNPPFTFVFVGLGLVLWTISNIVICWYLFSTGTRPGSFTIWSELFSNGAIMSIVLGVGGRLVPGILGWQEIVSNQREKYEGTGSFIRAVPTAIWISVLIYLISFPIEQYVVTKIGLLFRAFVIWFFAFHYWKLNKLPKEKSFLTWSIWVACWCFVVGSGLNVILISAYPHSLHTMLVGGFSLLTVLIATRVTLAHGSEGRAPERTSKMIPIFTALIVFAMVTRVTAFVWPHIYLNHLSYASLTWILGFFMWVIFAIPRMWRV
jgi:uncharacterized protein involved in response to NO